MKKLNFLLLMLPLLMLTQSARADILTTGEGTASSPYLISSVADLQQLSTLSNSSSWTGSAHQTAYYKLTADIDMSNKAWTGMSGFAGTFDGGNFTISNLAAPLCLTTANGAAIKNLTLEGSLTGGQYFAPFVNYCNGSLSIDKCTNKVSVTAEGVQVGGFIGYVAANASATITNSENQGAITSSAEQVGGFVGRLRTSANLTMTNCVNNANLTGLRAVGGMWGQANNGGTVLLTLCNNTGNITTTATSGDDSRAGGLVGFVYSAEKVTIEKCWNSGNVTGNLRRSGGIVGSVNSGTVEINNCYNIGNVSEKSAGRAILGYTASSNVSITNCWCSGNIQSKTLSTATYTNCYYTHYGEGNVTKIAAADVESGKLCFDINNGAHETIFHQTLSSDNHPVFDSNHELVFKTSSANDYYHNSVLSYLELVDNYNFSSTAETFTASTITYNRNMSNAWGTICLPFEVESNDDVVYYTTGEINGDVLTLTSTETVPAGTPAIFKMQNGSGTYSVTGNNVEVKSTVQTETDNSDEINLVGVFEQQIFDDVTTDNTNEYYYISNNKFMHATRKLTINPFRAYFTTAKSSTPSNGFSIAVNDDITAISALTGEGEVTVEAIYTVDGKQLRDLQQGLNIVKLSNGKVQKILVK